MKIRFLKIKIFALFILIFILNGCISTKKDIANVELLINNIRQELVDKIDINLKNNKDVQDKIIKNINDSIESNFTGTKNDIIIEIRKLQKMNADLRFNLENQSSYINKIDNKVDEGNYRFNDLKLNQDYLNNINKKLELIENKVFKLAISTGTVAVSSPEKIYDMARSEYNKNNYALAISGFTQVITNYSDSIYAENSFYDMACAYFAKKDWNLVCSTFETFLIKYPESEILSKFYLLKGKSLKNLGKISDMKNTYKYIIKNYPLTEEAKIAKDELDLKK